MSRPAHLSVAPPPAISRLATVGGHYPIPWITPFQTDTAESALIAVRSPHGLVLECTCQYGVGTPVFGQPCPTRQRLGMLGMLCNTCGEPVEDDERLFIGATRTGGHWRTAEPPTHPACAAYSAVACPTLRRDIDKVPVVLGHDHTLIDRVITSFDADSQPVCTFLPHGAPRLNYPLYGHVALFRPEQVRSMTLAGWLATEAPGLSSPPGHSLTGA